MKPLNILFLMTDQHRPDHVGFMPGSVFATPQLDKLAVGTVFANCQSVNPVCFPARTALLTGKYPRQIGTLHMSGDLSLQHPTSLRALQAAGYWTAGVGKLHYLQTWPWHAPRGGGLNLVRLAPEIREFGFDELWETSGKQIAVKNYDDYCVHLAKRGLLEDYRDYVEAAGANRNHPDPELHKDGQPWPFPEGDHIDIVTGDHIIARLRDRPRDRPFVLFGSFCSPHKPFDPPPRFLAEVPEDTEDDFLPSPDGMRLSPEYRRTMHRLRRAYRATIRLVDEQVGRIWQVLEEEGLWENTVVFFTSDHGEMMGDHGRIQKSAPWRSALTVPTVIRHPHYLREATCTAPVELTDLTATMLDVAGLDPQQVLSKGWPAFHDRVPGRSLLPILRGEVARVRDFSFSECAGKDAWQCVQSDRYKFVRYDTADPDEVREEFYDLVTDPSELRNCIADPLLADEIAWHRQRLYWTLAAHPPAQLTWAPLGLTPN